MQLVYLLSVCTLFVYLLSVCTFFIYLFADCVSIICLYLVYYPFVPCVFIICTLCVYYLFVPCVFIICLYLVCVFICLYLVCVFIIYSLKKVLALNICIVLCCPVKILFKLLHVLTMSLCQKWVNDLIWYMHKLPHKNICMFSALGLGREKNIHIHTCTWYGAWWIGTYRTSWNDNSRVAMKPACIEN